MIMVMIFFEKMIAITFACVFTAQVGIMMPLTDPNTVQAEDKSTSISCDGVGMCEKTECVDGVCDTSPTNSSNIIHSPSTPLSGADNGDSQSADNTTSSSSTPHDQRMSLRDGLKR
jgi:hypothetical protein